MALEVSSGNVHDSQMFEEVVMGMRLHNGSRGRPRTRPKEVAADKAYDSSYIRQYLRDRGIKANIACRRREPARGRPYRFDRKRYLTARSGVERFFGWLKSFHRLAIRYERSVVTFKALILLACFLIIWRFLQ